MLLMEEIIKCASLGSGVFQQQIEDVMRKCTTLITPAQWALFVWDFIYFWVFDMFLYLLYIISKFT